MILGGGGGVLKVGTEKENNAFVPGSSYIKPLWTSCNCLFTQSFFPACLKDYKYLRLAWPETEWKMSLIARGKRLEREDGDWSSEVWKGRWLAKERVHQGN